jgi:poly-gamma-glutamate synthesis protein (capsule biosynthesis protein)
MAHGLILAGDVNLMKVTDPGVPFRHIAAELHAADAVFANLECCLHLPPRQSHANEGFFADPQVAGNALRLSGIHAVGIANNVNYGDENIAASIATLSSWAARVTSAIRPNSDRISALRAHHRPSELRRHSRELHG